MVHLYDVVNEQELAKSIADGLVSARPHNELPLTILNYTPACQFGRHWSETNKACRGLIYNHETMEVVARPFPKFMNWDESGAPYPPTGPALRMPKMDGSLGILYSHVTETFEVDGVTYDSRKYAIATRGSMHSEQAEWATKFFNKTVMLGEKMFRPKEDKTYLFEIIYPENRIVVDYGEYEGLVLIDVIDNATGFPDTDEFDNCAWPDKVVRKPVAGFDSGQDQDIPAGDEGFVYLWPTRNFRTKMKAAEYVRIHRLVSGLTEKSIWQHLVNGGTVSDLKRDLPEEFHKFIDDVANRLFAEAIDIVMQTDRILDQIEHDLGERYDMVSRKEFALEAKKYTYHTKYLFAALDNKPVFPLALASVKPQREVSLVKED
jgi:RNA ligase